MSDLNTNDLATDLTAKRARSTFGTGFPLQFPLRKLMGGACLSLAAVPIMAGASAAPAASTNTASPNTASANTASPNTASPNTASANAAPASSSLATWGPVQGATSDKIFSTDKKTGKVTAASGSITQATLAGVKFDERGGKSSSLNATVVVLIEWGAVPSSYTDGVTYANRGEWESAVSNFQSAATDSDARPGVQASARLRALESMIEWGATDPARFADAISEAERFLADHGDDWSMPKVRALKARATWLSGDPAAARDGYKQLFEAGQAGADGYAPIVVADAALSAAQAALFTAETSTARELFDQAASAYEAIDSIDASVRARAKAGAEIARMASAESQLAKGDFSSAASSFDSAMNSAKTSAGKAAAKLGLGRALLGQGELHAAQLQLGWVAGLDHTSADRRAAALLGLGEALMASEGGGALAKSSLLLVKSEYGTTPSAAKATELLSGL